MKVYVITSGEYSDYCIQTVALSREKAEQICAMLNGSNGYRSDTATIEEYDTDEIQCETNEDVGLRYDAAFDYKTLENIYWCEPFYSFARNEIKRGLLNHGYGILISATFPKDMPQEKVRKTMCDRVAKWKAEKECL
jgi:hypothetical protein